MIDGDAKKDLTHYELSSECGMLRLEQCWRASQQGINTLRASERLRKLAKINNFVKSWQTVGSPKEMASSNYLEANHLLL